MEKEALLSVIVSDLKEVQLMVESFKGKEQIIPAFFKLTLQKIDNIRQEMELFEQLNGLVSPQYPIPPKPSPADKEPIVEVVAEVSAVVDIPQVEEKTIVQQPVEITTPDKKEEIMEWETEVKTSPTPIEEPMVAAVEQQDVEVKKEDPAPEVIEKKIVVGDKKVSEVSQSSSVKLKMTTLGDSLGADKSSLAEKISGGKENASTALIGKPVEDICQAIGINDRFLFIRELFNGNSTLLEQTLLQINGLSGYHEAASFIASNFNWDKDDNTVQAFMNAVKRRFH